MAGEMDIEIIQILTKVIVMREDPFYGTYEFDHAGIGHSYAIF